MVRNDVYEPHHWMMRQQFIRATEWRSKKEMDEGHAGTLFEYSRQTPFILSIFIGDQKALIYSHTNHYQSYKSPVSLTLW
jgi:hypothetical protein